MALASELQTRSAIVTAIKAAIPADAKVYPRIRRPQKGRLDDFKRLYVDNVERVHLWMVRRAQRTPEVDAFNRLQRVVVTYQMLGYFSLVDNDTDALSSEAIFQLEIETVAAGLEVDNVFGLPGVTHRGLQLPVDFEDVFFGDVLCHEAKCRLVVDVEDC